MMTRYEVSLYTISGSVQVEAENKEEALSKALENSTFGYMYDVMAPDVEISVEEIDAEGYPWVEEAECTA